MIKIHSQNNQKVLEKAGHILVGYLTAGYPDKEEFFKTLKQCETAGIDIFEIGYPAKNPAADGEVIQHAHQTIDQTIATDIEFWQRIRKEIESPIWLMAYKADIMEQEFYLELAKDSLIDAFVIPDMTFDERLALENELKDYSVDVMGFISPDMELNQVKLCLENEALIYQQLYSGPTGLQIASDEYSDLLNQVKQYSYIKVFAGFGIATPERVKELLTNGFDGVIVGTAMMKKRKVSSEHLIKFVVQLKEATKGV